MRKRRFVPVSFSSEGQPGALGLPLISFLVPRGAPRIITAPRENDLSEIECVLRPAYLTRGPLPRFQNPTFSLL